MYSWLVVGIGGFFGAVLRYIVSGWAQGKLVSFPLGTLTVNLIGCFFISLVMFSSEYWGFFGRETRIFLAIGVIGSFTTMSTFGYEVFRMIEQNDLFSATTYTFGMLTLCLFAIFLGKIVALNIWRI